MRKRLRIIKIRRGRFEVSVDGNSLGHVVRKPYSSEPFGWWWAEPSRPVVSDNREVDQNPENPLWWGLRLVGRPGVRPMRRRTEAVLTLCDMQGLVEPIAEMLWAGQVVDESDEEWIARVVEGFSDVDEYHAFIALSRRRGATESPRALSRASPDS